MFRKPIEIETRLAPPWVTAIMLWPFILYRPGLRTPGTVAHERYHWYECRRCWVLPWYLCYLVLGLFYLPRKRWRQHPMEVYAYAVGARVGKPSDLGARERRNVESVAELEAFFRSCDAREGRAVEPDWDEHLRVMAESRSRGESGT